MKSPLAPRFLLSLRISVCPLLALPLWQMEGSQALHARPPGSRSFLKRWSCGMWPPSSGTQFKGTSFSEKSHLSSSAKNNRGERLHLKAEPPRAWCGARALNGGLAPKHGPVHAHAHACEHLFMEHIRRLGAGPSPCCPQGSADKSPGQGEGVLFPSRPPAGPPLLGNLAGSAEDTPGPHASPSSRPLATFTIHLAIWPWSQRATPTLHNQPGECASSQCAPRRDV